MKIDELMLKLKPAAAFQPLPPVHDRRAWAALDDGTRSEFRFAAQQALEKPMAQITHSMLMKGIPFIEAYRQRREQVSALLLGCCGEGPEHYLSALVDWVWALIEQGQWWEPDLRAHASQSLQAAQLPDPGAALIDSSAAETAALLALCERLLGATLPVEAIELSSHIRMELWRRIIQPLTRGQEKVLVLSADQIPSAMEHLMLAVLMTDVGDGPERWFALRRLLETFEQYLRSAQWTRKIRQGLERYMPDVYSVFQCLSMISLSSGGLVELRDEMEFLLMAALPVQMHVGGGFFVNPGGDSLKPYLWPEALFRLGEGANSDEVCALAAYLTRPGVGARQPRGQALPLVQRLLCGLRRSAFLAERPSAPKNFRVERQDMQVVGALSGGGCYAALLGAFNQKDRGHMDAGDICLTYRGRPVLMDPGYMPGAEYHSVPVIGGYEQGNAERIGREVAEIQMSSDFVALSMDIAGAYPKKAGLNSWQRTLLMNERDGSVRLIDVCQMERGERRELGFRFITPEEPKIGAQVVALGSVLLSWSGELNVKIEKVELQGSEQRLVFDRFYRVMLRTPEAVEHGKFDFLFEFAEHVR